MACRKRDVYVQQFQLVVFNRSQVGGARRFINLVGTIALRMQSPLASLRWELAKRRVPQKKNLPDPESTSRESAVALAGY